MKSCFYILMSFFLLCSCNRKLDDSVFHNINKTDDIDYLALDSLVRSWAIFINQEYVKAIDSLLNRPVISGYDCEKLALLYSTFNVGSYYTDSMDDVREDSIKQQGRRNLLLLYWFRQALLKGHNEDVQKIRIASTYIWDGDITAGERILRNIIATTDNDTIRCRAQYELLNSFFTPKLDMSRVKRSDIKMCDTLGNSFARLFPEDYSRQIDVFSLCGKILKKKGQKDYIENYIKAAQIDMSGQDWAYLEYVLVKQSRKGICMDNFVVPEDYHPSYQYQSSGSWACETNIYSELLPYYYSHGQYFECKELIEYLFAELSFIDGSSLWEEDLIHYRDSLPYVQIPKLKFTFGYNEWMRPFIYKKTKDVRFDNSLIVLFLKSVDAYRKSVIDRGLYASLGSEYIDYLKLALNTDDPLWAYNIALFVKNIHQYTYKGYKAYLRRNNPFPNDFQKLDSLNRSISGDHSLEDFSTDREIVEIYSQIREQDRDLPVFFEENEVKYTDVAACLKANELAIEFISFIDINDLTTEYYDALILSADRTVQRVRIGTAADIRGMLEKGYSLYSSAKNNLIAKTFAGYINDGSKVYYSPCGLLAQINIEALLCDGGINMSEKYDMVRLSSTKELLRISRSQSNSLVKAAVFGGVNYAETSDTESTSISRNEDGIKWSFLPGSLQEAESITRIMNDNGISTNLYTGDMASEEKFVSQTVTASDILHVATHGFYFNDKDIDKLTYHSLNKEQLKYNALLRAGLIFAGGQAAWDSHDEEIGGVLLADEISRLDLESVDLISLSVCNSGKGEITYEGTEGLQSAFKSAGVGSMMLNLWTVDDTASQVFYSDFYTHLCQDKMSKREAFQASIKRLRNMNQYASPYYWAGYILID